ncbi:MAG: EAL domain-containing protein [Pseudomonadota bacterium]
MTAAAIFSNVAAEQVPGGDVIQSALRFVRNHLDMEAAYLSEFIGDDLVFRAVDAPGFEDLASPGKSLPLNQVYCEHILAGRLPEIIKDTQDIALAKTIPITDAVGIRSHVSVPIKRRDGSTYGMFCVLSRSPKADLNTRDLEVMRAFADISADQVNEKISVKTELEQLRSDLERVIEEQLYSILLQPIMNVTTRHPVGFEALTRFKSEPYRSPNLWFDDANRVNMQVELELAVIVTALKMLPHLPEPAYISVNASPVTVASGKLFDVLNTAPLDRVVLEVTEHAEITDPVAMLSEISNLRAHGLRLAVDDAGAGYSGLQQIVQLNPDIIKLDISLTSGIEKDIVRRFLAEALVGFAEQTEAKIVAEGIETEAELAALRALRVPLGQGYLLGRPADLITAQSWFPGASLKKA